ncbi:MAG: DUF2877 domain-containing protein [Myxococcales bacterium]|nr:DUF2877 domain-containing protein [Myxococcales bacterium]
MPLARRVSRHAVALFDEEGALLRWCDVRIEALGPRGVWLSPEGLEGLEGPFTLDGPLCRFDESLSVCLPPLDRARFEAPARPFSPLSAPSEATRQGALDAAFEAAYWRLRDALAEGLDPTAAARALVGLGPGLTPSGDDLLGGLFLGARCFGHGLDALKRSVLDEAKTATHAIARARLEDHAAGLCLVAESAVLAALATDHRPRREAAVARLSALGHHSGHDFLRGLGLAAAIYGPTRPAR